jgi:cellulose synthase (UDP-forming)
MQFETQPPLDTTGTRHLYDYLPARPFWFKVSYILSIITWFVIATSYIFVFKDNPIYWILGAPVIAYIVFYNILSKIIQLYYKKFDLGYHHSLKLAWAKKEQFPTVDIFLPVCGEPIDVLLNTWDGVLKLTKQYPGATTVYVLDDKAHETVKSQANRFGFTYFARPNLGHMKKAGNLKYAFDRTSGEMVVILDADFRPEANFLEELLPYFSKLNTRDKGEKVGIVQSPQSFILTKKLAKENPMAYGAANIQEYFYRFIQPARQTFGDGAICVGSNAIYRRSALIEINGTAQMEHSEDVWTGFRLIAKGWKLLYVPLCVAFGDCPDNAHSFYKQQSRWCSGSMSLMMSKEFWVAKVPWFTKLCFISGFTFYISTIMYLLLPLISLINIFYGTFGIEPWLYSIVAISTLNAVVQLHTHIYPKWKVSTVIAHMLASWTYVFTLVNLLIKRDEPWLPTGAKMSLGKNFLTLRTVVGFYVLILFVGLVASVFVAGRNSISPLNTSYFGWIGIQLITQSLALYGLYRYV